MKLHPLQIAAYFILIIAGMKLAASHYQCYITCPVTRRKYNARNHMDDKETGAKTHCYSHYHSDIGYQYSPYRISRQCGRGWDR